ncbi:hypothetical protein A2U01_0001287, partial [Trifolium medium]|nr:hypothetical protein [Trifolium medium]
MDKGLIRNSKSPWSCTAFYVNKAAEKERGVPREMTTPYRGRGRGRGQGGRGSNRLPYQELTIPLIGDWTTVNYRSQLAGGTLPPKKEDKPSSSGNSSKEITSYKDVAVNETALEQALEYFENPVTEKIIYIDDDDLTLPNIDGWSLKTRYLESRGYAGLY